MANAVLINKFEVKSYARPDEIRAPDKTRAEIVRVGGFTLGRISLQPGWRWSECIKPVAKTESCELSHLGYAISGRVTVKLNDGTTKTIVAGESYTIPPGHDAWVEGAEPFVGLEVMSAEQFAQPAADASGTKPRGSGSAAPIS